MKLLILALVLTLAVNVLLLIEVKNLGRPELVTEYTTHYIYPEDENRAWHDIDAITYL